MGDPELPNVFTRAQARAAGLSDDQIDRRLAGGDFEQLHRGVARRRTDAKPPKTRLMLPPELAAGLLACGSRDVVFSHASAARLLRLPKPLGGWGRPQFTSTSGSGHVRNGVQIRVAPLDPDEVFQFRTVPVTRPLRTALDCLRTLPARDALAIVDAALHNHWFTLEQLFAAADAQRRWPGMGQAREVMALGNGQRESPLESWSAWGFHLAGLPVPEWQVVISSENGDFVARVDTWWWGVAGEADGRSKYALAAADRGGAGSKELFAVLRAERQRERALHDVGADVVRWSTPDVLQPNRLEQLAHRIRSAISYAEETHRFTGTVAPYAHRVVQAPNRRR